MPKIKDNISNHSKTSREYSSLISSSNEEESEKHQKTLQNFSEKDIRRLSRKLNDKSILLLKEVAKNSNENNKENVENLMGKHVITKSEPVLEGSSDDECGEHMLEDGNDLAEDNVLMLSRNTTKKENSQIEIDKVNYLLFF